MCTLFRNHDKSLFQLQQSRRELGEGVRWMLKPVLLSWSARKTASSAFGRLHVSEQHDVNLAVQMYYRLIGDTHGAFDVHA